MKVSVSDAECATEFVKLFSPHVQMAAQFNEGVESLLKSLFHDAVNDTAYNLCLPLYDRATDLIDAHPTALELEFIQIISTHPEVRQCLTGNNLDMLKRIAQEVVEDTQVSGAVRELCLGIDNPDLFNPSVIAKVWKKLAKLVDICNLHDYVYGQRNASTPPTEDASKAVEEATKARIDRFNHGYRMFLERMLTAFPVTKDGEVSREVLDVFDKRVQEDPESVIKEFKACVLPVVPSLLAASQSKEKKDATETVLDPYFSESPDWFRTLPLLSHQNVDMYWDEQMANIEIKTKIMQGIGTLTLTMTGADAIIYSPLVQAITKKAKEIVGREKMTVDTINPAANGFNKSRIFNLLFELLEEIPAATNNKVTQEDMNALIANAMMGSSEMPDAFDDLLPLDGLDEDCLQYIMDMPELGQYLGPVLAGFQGQLSGMTGASSPFGGSVSKPGHLARD